MTYYTLFATKQTPPPSALRNRDYDYKHGLSRAEQIIVDRVLRDEWPTNNLNEKITAFLRRYHGDR